jgi:hypothetical protein
MKDASFLSLLYRADEILFMSPHSEEVAQLRSNALSLSVLLLGSMLHQGKALRQMSRGSWTIKVPKRRKYKEMAKKKGQPKYPVFLQKSLENKFYIESSLRR